MSPDEYRARFGLAGDVSLVAAAVREAVHRDEAGRLDALSAANRARAAKVLQDLDACAREVGYTSFEQLVRSTAGLPLAEVSALVGKTGKWAQYWRDKFGVRGAYLAGREQRQRHGLAEVAAGTQPVRADGKLRCLVCGVWRDLLDQHAQRAHGLSVLQYRARFGLAATVTLANADVWRGRDSDGWRDRYEQRAREHGYADVAGVLQRCDDDTAAQVLGVRSRTIRSRRAQGSSSAPG